MGRSLLSISDAQYTQELLGLQNQEFDLEMKLLDVVDDRKKQLIKARLGKLKEMMDMIQRKINKSPPVDLQFQETDHD